MSSNYFLLDGAYNEVSLYNSPDPIQDIQYPCLVSYPSISQFPPPTANELAPIETVYDNMSQAYNKKPCAYCHQGT